MTHAPVLGLYRDLVRSGAPRVVSRQRVAARSARTRTLAIVATFGVLLAGCWLPQPYVDTWADNQSDQSLVVSLGFPGDAITYDYAVRPHSHGILLAGMFSVPSRVVVTGEDGTTLAAKEVSDATFGVLISATGDVEIREGAVAPFRDGEFQMVPPADS